jgi:enamine deaminase RidA (YjgF/YER057c/UK114 family)
VFEAVEAALSAHGFHFTDTVRTWFYLDRLLEWYDAFNAVRTAFFAERGVLAKLIPASTGIGAANSFRSALTCNVLAVQPRTAAVRLETVSSPLQISALSYRSSFSRAVELSFPSYRQLLVSGTASIDSEGRTAHAGDLAGQIALTMQVVEKLLRSRGMDWTDVTRGSAYFADLRQRALFEAYGAERALPPMPLALAQAAICRRELLFEIELDAARGGE